MSCFYGDLDGFISHGLPPDVASSVHSQTDDQEQSLSAASSYADSYLASRYILPIRDAGPVLTQKVYHIAAYELAVSKNLASENGTNSHLYIRWKAARDYLEDIASGRVTPPGLVDSSSPTADAESTIAAVSSRVTSFTADF